MRSFWRTRTAIHWFRQLVCWHKYRGYDLIFGFGNNPKKHTHFELSRCTKCGKLHERFSGTRDEWLEYMRLQRKHHKYMERIV